MRRLAAGGHGGDDQVGAGDDVAAAEEAQAGGGAGFGVGKEQAPVAGLQAGGGGGEGGVGVEAEGQDGHIGGDDEVGAFDRDGLAAALFVGLAQFHAQALDLRQAAIWPGVEGDRLGEVLKAHAFFEGHLAVFAAPGHLGFGAAVEAEDVIGAQAHGGAQAVEGGVAATDDGDALADDGAMAQLGRQELGGGVGAHQEVDGFVDAGEVFAGGAEGHVYADADGDEDGLEAIVQQLVDGAVFADDGIAHKFCPGAGQAVPDLVDEGLFKLEVGDAVGEQAAGGGAGVEDGDGVAQLQQLLGAAQPGGTGADDGDAVSGAGGGGDLVAVGAALVGGGKGFKGAEGDGLAALVAAHAGAFAEAVLGADAPADLGQGVGLAVDFGGIDKVAVFDEPHGVGDVVLGGAGALAGGGVGAVDAARGFVAGPIVVDPQDGLVEIVDPLSSGAHRQAVGGFGHAGFTVLAGKITR